MEEEIVHIKKLNIKKIDYNSKSKSTLFCHENRNNKTQHNLYRPINYGNK